MVCPVYIAELAPAARRGRLGALFQMGIVIGIFVTLLINAQIQGLGDEAWNTESGWRWMFFAEVIPAVLLLMLLFVAPESPRWLLSAGRDAEAQAILAGVGGAHHAERELQTIRQALEHEEASFLELFRGRLWRPLLLAAALMALSQLSGINAIMYYSTKIMTTAGAGVENAFTASVTIGLVNVLFTFVALAFVDKAGRRPLLLVGLSVQVIALGATGWMFFTDQGGPALLAAIVLFIAAFAMALGPIPWIVCSEIFPTRVRGRAMSVATFVIWTTCYLSRAVVSDAE